MFGRQQGHKGAQQRVALVTTAAARRRAAQRPGRGMARLHRCEPVPLSGERLSSLAGARVFARGKAYRESQAVLECVICRNGVEAWVMGGALYRVSLWSEPGRLYWQCNCPIGGQGNFCKHAVAVGLAWLEPEQQAGRTIEAELENALNWLALNARQERGWLGRIRTALATLASTDREQAVLIFTANALTQIAQTGWVEMAAGAQIGQLDERRQLLKLLCRYQAAACWRTGRNAERAARYLLKQQLIWIGAGDIACSTYAAAAYESIYGHAWRAVYERQREMQQTKHCAVSGRSLTLAEHRQLVWLTGRESAHTRGDNDLRCCTFIR